MVLAEDRVEIAQFIKTVAMSESSVLLLDYDGTLAPFSVDRQQALPYPGVVPTLQEIIASGRTRVVIVTGRSAEEVVPLLGIYPHPEIWGAHGVQRLRPDGTCEIPSFGEDVSRALADASQWLGSQGLQTLTEHKPGGIAVHWRGFSKAKAEELRHRVLRAWFPIAHRASMSVIEFDGGVEMRVSNLNKGNAVRTILDEIDGEPPIAYLGDDATDERAFDTLRTRGLSVLVRHNWRKTSARVWLQPPHDLLDFLTQWMDACYSMQPEGKRGPMLCKDEL